MAPAHLCPEPLPLHAAHQGPFLSTQNWSHLAPVPSPVLPSSTSFPFLLHCQTDSEDCTFSAVPSHIPVDPQLPTLYMWVWLMLLGFPEARELGRGDQVAPCIVAAFSRVPVHPSTEVLWGVAHWCSSC